VKSSQSLCITVCVVTVVQYYNPFSCWNLINNCYLSFRENQDLPRRILCWCNWRWKGIHIWTSAGNVVILITNIISSYFQTYNPNFCHHFFLFSWGCIYVVALSQTFSIDLFGIRAACLYNCEHLHFSLCFAIGNCWSLIPIAYLLGAYIYTSPFFAESSKKKIWLHQLFAIFNIIILPNVEETILRKVQRTTVLDVVVAVLFNLIFFTKLQMNYCYCI